MERISLSGMTFEKHIFFKQLVSLPFFVTHLFGEFSDHTKLN